MYETRRTGGERGIREGTRRKNTPSESHSVVAVASVVANRSNRAYDLSTFKSEDESPGAKSDLSSRDPSHDSTLHFAGAPPGSAIRRSECIKSRPRATKQRAAYRQSFSFRMCSFRQKGAKGRSIRKRRRGGRRAGKGCARLEGSETCVKSCTFVNSYESLPFAAATARPRHTYGPETTGGETPAGLIVRGQVEDQVRPLHLTSDCAAE